MEPPVRYAPTAEEKNLAESQGIRDVKVATDETTALFTFRARASSAPVVEIGGEPPKSGLGGQLEFPARYGLSVAEVVPDSKVLAQTNFKAEFSKLDRRTTYYYIVTVPGSDGTATRQIHGRFTTKESRAQVTVVYTEIDLTNDSDANSNGDLVFDLFVDNNLFASYGSGKELLDWSDQDGPRRINESTTLANVTDTFLLAVNGCDDDSTVGPNGCGFRFTTPKTRPEGNWDSDTNVARQAFDIRDFPGAEVRHDFVLQSMQQSGGEGDLSFNVKGYFIIKRD
jgi:hypothetical protein